MNQDKINAYNHQGRLRDKESFIRLSKSNDNTIKKQQNMRTKNIKIKLTELADDSLKEILQDLTKRLSTYNSETSEIITEIKKISRILKLRKKPILTD